MMSFSSVELTILLCHNVPGGHEWFLPFQPKIARHKISYSSTLEWNYLLLILTKALHT